MPPEEVAEIIPNVKSLVFFFSYPEYAPGYFVTNSEHTSNLARCAHTAYQHPG